MDFKRSAVHKEYVRYGEAAPGEEYLLCDACGRKCFLLDRYNYECGMLIGNVRCKGKLVNMDAAPAEFRPKAPEPEIKCTKCGRKADNPDFNGRYCNWRLSEGKYCDGILKLD